MLCTGEKGDECTECGNDLEEVEYQRVAGTMTCETCVFCACDDECPVVIRTLH